MNSSVKRRKTDLEFPCYKDKKNMETVVKIKIEAEASEPNFHEGFCQDDDGHSKVKRQLFYCEMCKCNFSDDTNFEYHLSIHMSEKPFHCETCKLLFSDFSQLTIHMQTHSSTTLFHCAICGSGFCSKTHLLKHMKGHENDQSSSAAISDEETFSECIDSKSDIQGVECKPLTPAVVSDEKTLLHTNSNLNIQRPEYKPPLSTAENSEKTFLHRSDLNSDIKGHCSSERLQCEDCGLKFCSNRHLIKHMEWHKSDEPPLNGMSGGKTFLPRSDSKSYIQGLNNRESFHCDLCSANFSDFISLRDHVRIHTDEKTITRNESGVKFSRDTSLMRYIDIYTGKKAFICDACGSKFSRRSNLNAHQRLHTGEKPFKCDICDSKFAWNSNLKVHMRIHSGEKPYHCDSCGENFPYRAGLKNHQQTFHGIL